MSESTAPPQPAFPADAALIRTAPVRAVTAGVVVLLLVTGFTVGGISMLRAGEGFYAVPFAVAAPVIQICVIMLVIAVLAVRRSRTPTAGGTLKAARRVMAIIRAVLIGTVGALVALSLVRLSQGDTLTLLTAAIIGVPAALLARGVGRIHRHLTHTLTDRSKALSHPPTLT